MKEYKFEKIERVSWDSVKKNSSLALAIFVQWCGENDHLSDEAKTHVLQSWKKGSLDIILKDCLRVVNR